MKVLAAAYVGKVNFGATVGARVAREHQSFSNSSALRDENHANPFPFASLLQGARKRYELACVTSEASHKCAAVGEILDPDSGPWTLT